MGLSDDYVKVIVIATVIAWRSPGDTNLGGELVRIAEKSTKLTIEPFGEVSPLG